MRAWTSIRWKMTVLIFVCAFIPLLSVSVLSYYKSADVVGEQLTDYNRYAMSQLQSVTNMHLREMDSLSRDIQGYLLAPGRRITSEPRSYSEYQELNSFLDFLTFHVSMIVEGLFVYTPDGQLISSRNINKGELLERDWWIRAHSNLGRDTGWWWTGFHDGSYYSSPQPSGPLISLIVPVQLKAGVPKGSLVVVDVNARAVANLFYSFEQDTKAYLEVTDAHGQVIYQTAGRVHPPDSEMLRTETTVMNEWRISARVPYEEIDKSAGVIRSYAFVVGGLSLIAAFLLARLLSGSLSRRIVSINESMLSFSRGNLEAAVKVQGNDELSQLGHRFNFMTAQIRALIDNISHTEKQKKEAELQALHYQINPHLILNTLNAIQWRARIAGRQDIDRMIFHLGALLSESLDIRQELVALHEELDTISHYLKIQYYRYGDAFTYVEDMEPGLDQLLIPRMTLQPLFENIFYHAFDDGEGIIGLEVYREQDHVVLRLSDDGKGIKSTGSVIRPSPPLKGRGGLGLYNVNQKFKLHFGETYGLRILPEITEGTVIEIRWPYCEKEE